MKSVKIYNAQEACDGLCCKPGYTTVPFPQSSTNLDAAVMFFYRCD